VKPVWVVRRYGTTQTGSSCVKIVTAIPYHVVSEQSRHNTFSAIACLVLLVCMVRCLVCTAALVRQDDLVDFNRVYTTIRDGVPYGCPLPITSERFYPVVLRELTKSNTALLGLYCRLMPKCNGIARWLERSSSVTFEMTFVETIS